jgi:diguanylate cyclase (GGDEF)-like protein
MISLRKAMHQDLEESLRSALESYRSALAAVGDAGARAYPPTGDNLKQSLLKLQESLLSTATPSDFARTEQSVGQELKAWSDSASHYYLESAEEVKTLLLQIAKVAAEVGERDQRYSVHFQTLAERLQGAAKLDNITFMRQSLTSSAAELVDCVNKMTEDGKRTVEQLRAQISGYEQRMQESERLASLDPLTGVSNRRILERQLQRRAAEASPFFLIYLDLNQFKQVNDTLGHQAGDDLLKQFSDELRHGLRPSDVVGRMGGDEFAVLIDGLAGNIEERIAHVKKRVNGDYSLATDRGKRKLPISAAVGIAVWKPGVTIPELLSAADRAMYQDKRKA